MIEKLSNWLARIAKGWLVLVLFVMEGAFMGFILPRAEAVIKAVSGGVGVIDLMFMPPPAQILSAIEAYGSARPFYIIVELTADILYPITYTFFYSLLITLLLRSAFSADSKLQWLNVLPFGAWVFDLLENVYIVTLLVNYPAQSPIVAGMLTVVNGIKWAFAGASILALLFGLGAWIVKKVKK